MKNLIKLLFFAGIIFLAAFSCDDEKNDPSEYKPIEIKKITDFGCEDCSIKIKPEYNNDTFLLILNEEDLAENIEYLIVKNLPPINFEKYFLIIGAKYYTTLVEIIKETAKENDSEIIYTIDILVTDALSPSAIYFHAFIEKPQKEIYIYIEVI